MAREYLSNPAKIVNLTVRNAKTNNLSNTVVLHVFELLITLTQ